MASATFSISNVAAYTHTRLPLLPRRPSTSHFSSSFIAPALRRTQRLTLTRAKFDKFQGDDSVEPDDDGEDPQQPPQFELSEEEDDRFL